MTHSSPPPATAEGTLATTPLAQVLVHAADKKLCGTLELEGAQGPVATVVLKDGWPCKVRTTEPNYLGMVLHALGLIDDTKLNASLARLAKERRPHGQILLDMGAVTPDGLLRGLRQQIAGKLEPLFALDPSTVFKYYDGVDSLSAWGGPEIVPVDPHALLWSALQRSPPWVQVEAAITHMGRAAPLQVRPLAELDRFRFPKAAGELLEMMRQMPLTLDGMIATGLVDKNEARLLVYCLLITKQLALGAAATMPPPPRPPTMPPPRPPSPSTPDLAGARTAPPARQPTIPPEIPIRPASSPGSSPPTRGSAFPPRASAPPPGVALTPELAALRQRIIDRVATVNEEDFFQVLEIPRESPIPAVQAAYMALAKTWHPDRLAPQLFDVRDLSLKVFMRMTEAKTTLSDPDKRDAYITSLRRGIRPDRAQAAQATNAGLEYQKAEVFLKKRSLAEAAEHARRAREAEPANGDYLALLIWIEVEREGANNDNLHKHLEALEIALKLNERCERAYHLRALIYKRLNKPDKAHADFKAALTINPKNIDAGREVHLYKKRST